MLLMEGAATIAMGAAAYFIFVDRPQEARWLSLAEKDWIAAELAVEQRRTEAPDSSALRAAIGDPRAWLAAAVWCTTLIGANGMIFWLPQVIREMSSLGDFAVGVLSATPWIGVGLGMLVNSWHSDRTQERYWHVGLALGVAATGLFLASTSGRSALALTLLFVGGFGLGAAQGVFWSIPTSFLHRSVAAAGITLINLVGNLGSLAGPYAIGVIRAGSDSFAAPIWFVAGVLCTGVAFLALLRLQERAHSRPPSLDDVGQRART
jgi:ACS family tartrate transporter-like MFS transporter